MANYGEKASEKVERAVHEQKRGTLRPGGSGKKVTSRKQAIAIGLGVDDSPDGQRQPSGARGALKSEHGPTNPGGTDGEHSGQKPERNADRGDDEAPETPTDEPSPIPVQDPPSGDRARPPQTVRGGRP